MGGEKKRIDGKGKTRDGGGGGGGGEWRKGEKKCTVGNHKDCLSTGKEGRKKKGKK